jgi:hypothetical protein
MKYYYTSLPAIGAAVISPVALYNPLNGTVNLLRNYSAVYGDSAAWRVAGSSSLSAVWDAPLSVNVASAVWGDSAMWEDSAVACKHYHGEARY